MQGYVNGQWIHPERIDYQDALNPLVLNQWQDGRAQANYEALQSPIAAALRNAAGYQLRLQAIPNGATTSIAARANFEDQFRVNPGSYIYAITATSAQSEGFQLQIRDIGTGGKFFNQPISSASIIGGTLSGVTSKQFLLPRPRCVASGFLAAQITNLSANANLIQVVLWIAQRRPDYTLFEPTAWNTILDEDIARVLNAIRYTPEGAQLPPGPPVAPVRPSEPFFYTATVATPAAGTVDSPVVSFRVPAGYEAFINSIQNKYTGPGFTDGSNDLIWRIAVDGNYAPGFDNLNVTVGVGDLQKLSAPIIAQPHQLVEYRISVAATAALGQNTTCTLEGYFKPK
jgi:hypothetical protein